MFLSRLLLSNRSPEVRRDLANVHNMHRRVLTAFADRELEDGARRAYGALYRTETSSRGEVALLVQSEAEPNWTRLPAGYLLECFEPNPALTSLAPVVARLKPGIRLRFRLRANATKRLFAGKEKRGARVELFGTERLLAWLLRKAERGGFQLAEREGLDVASELERYRVRIAEEPKVRGRRNGAALTFGSTLFEGELVVTDPQAFAATLKQGIGTARAYGFGLLSVAPT